MVEILAGIVTSTPEVRGDVRARRARAAARATSSASRSWPTRSSGSAREGAAPFYTGDVAAAIVDWLAERGGLLTAADLAAYEVVDARAGRGRLSRPRACSTNPPPSAGGTLIALRARAARPRAAAPPTLAALVAAMERDPGASARPTFLDGLDEPGFVERFLAAPARLDDARRGARRRRAARAA